MPFFRGRPECLQAFRIGERAVVEEVYWAHLSLVEKIVRHGFHKTGAGEAARVPTSEIADVVQEVFARAFREKARLAYDGIREYAPFLTTIARNVVADWGRRRGHSVVEIPIHLDELASSDDRSWAEEAVMQIVDGYVAALPATLRSVHEQRYIIGHSQTETARTLGMTRQQVRTLEEKLRSGVAHALRRADLAGGVK
jgi:RNA polymerase sigma-70 factor (ECF subfamily)